MESARPALSPLTPLGAPSLTPDPEMYAKAKTKLF